MRRIRTFRARLTARVTILCVALLSVSGAVIFGASSEAMYARLDDALVRVARTEIASATDTGYIHVHNTEAQPLMLSDRRDYETYVWIEDDRDNVVARTSNLGTATPIEGSEKAERAAWNGVPTFADVLVNRQRLRAVYYPLKDSEGDPMVAVVGIPIEPVENSRRSVAAVVIGVIAFGSIASFLASILFSRGMTRPLARLAHAAQRIEFNPESPPLALPPAGTEIDETVGAINQMIERVNHSLHDREKLIQVQRSLLADASHELRTPIANIHGTVEVELRRDRSASDYREALSAVQTESSRMMRIVEDLLTLARTDLGDLVLHFEPVDLSAVAREALDACAARAQERSIQTALVGENVPMQGDPARLRQVLDNLLENALRHCAASVRVEVASEPTHAVLRISNDGEPISEADLPLIFGRFYRGDKSRARVSGGTGLGLAISKSIVDAHGGTIEAANIAGSTVFTCRFPTPAGASGEP